MINIKTLLDNPPQRIGGFKKTIKTCKKMWQVGDNWVHQVVLTDETGDILTDVMIGKQCIKLQRTQEIHVVVGETRNDYDKIVLFVEEYVIASATEPPYVPNFTGEEKVVRSKIKCWLVASGIQSKQINLSDNFDVAKAKIELLVDFIME